MTQTTSPSMLRRALDRTSAAELREGLLYCALIAARLTRALDDEARQQLLAQVPQLVHRYLELGAHELAGEDHCEGCESELREDRDGSREVLRAVHNYSHADLALAYTEMAPFLLAGMGLIGETKTSVMMAEMSTSGQHLMALVGTRLTGWTLQQVNDTMLRPGD